MRVFMHSVLRLAFCALLGVPFSAPAGESVGYVYWAEVSEGRVWRARLDGSEVTNLATERALGSMVFDQAGGWLYFVLLGLEPGQGEIRRVQPDGSQLQIVVPGLNEPADLELDLSNNRVYWIDGSDIQRAPVGGGAAQTVHTSGIQLNAIAVDGAQNALFVAEEDAGTGPLTRRNLDGGSPVVLLPDELCMNDVEADPANLRIYYSSCSTGTRVGRVGYDGSDPIEDFGGIDVQTLRLRDGNVYYVNSSDLFRMNLDGLDDVALSTNNRWSSLFDVDPPNDRGWTHKELTLDRQEPDGSNPVRIALFPRGIFHSVAVDPLAGEVYFTDARVDAVFSVPVTGGLLGVVWEDASLLDNVRGLALDSVNDMLYWANVENGPDGGIFRAARNGGGVIDPLVTNLESPHDVALDMANGRVYWTQSITDTISGDTFGKIRRADFNGGNVADVITGLGSSIRGLAIDNVNGRVYWTDHVSDEIRSSNLEGGDIQVVADGLSNPHDVFVDDAAGKLYWTEGASNDPGSLTGAIRRSDLDGSNPELILDGIRSTLRDLWVVFVSEQPEDVFEDGFEDLIR